ncbi:MAG: hypothetical protein ABEJ31_04915 [Haloarculaceae archaeon]
MQVFCTDGTVFACQDYELTEYGLKLYGQEADADDDRYASDREPIGFVPFDRLWYVLPSGVVSTSYPVPPQPTPVAQTQQATPTERGQQPPGQPVATTQSQPSGSPGGQT